MSLAHRLWPTLHERLDGYTGFEQTGHLMLIEREADLRGAPARLWLQNQHGIVNRLVEKQELQTLEPHLSDQVQAALLCSQDGVADHTATTRAFAAAARRLGAEIKEAVTVTGLEHEGDKITAILTSQEERIPIQRTLLLLSNSHVPPMVERELGVILPVWWRLPQVLFTDVVDPIPIRHLIGHAHRTLAMKRGPSDNVMISGGWHGRWNPKTGQGETDSDQVAGNLAEAVAVYPALAGVGVQQAIADRLETQTIDGLPIIDLLPGLSNGLFATGWSGHGWAIAPAVTQLLAEWAFSGERAEMLWPFRYDRFLTQSKRNGQGNQLHAG
jgi:sarcosine oxidase subunit beta